MHVAPGPATEPERVVSDICGGLLKGLRARLDRAPSLV